MNSISKHIDEYDVAQEIRLSRQVHKGSFLLLEGQTDIKRFAKFICGDSCELVNCFGRKRAIGAIEILYDEGFLGVVAVVDADFDRVLSQLFEHEGIVYSESHDLDLDWAVPAVVHRYLVEVADEEKYAAFRDAGELIEKILIGLQPISVARLLNRNGKIKRKMSKVNAADVYSNFKVDVDLYLDLLFDGVPDSAGKKKVTKALIQEASRRTFDHYQLTNGHDFHCALGACLRQDIGSRHHVHTWGKEVEMHIRLGYGDEQFMGSAVYRALVDWERENRPYRVLHQQLTSRGKPIDVTRDDEFRQESSLER